MSLDEGLSRLIGRIYESVYDDDAWQRVMRELLELTGSRLALMTSADLELKEFNRTIFYGPETSAFADGVREFDEELWETDPSFAWATANPQAGFCNTADIIPKADYLSHPFIVWNRSRMGSTHWAVAWSQPRDGLSLSLSLHPPADVGPVDAKVQSLLRLVFDHLERALRLAARPPDFSRDSGAIVALDRRGRVVAMSPRAEELVALADGLSVETRRLHASSPQARRHLQETIASASSAPVSGGAGGGVRIARPSGRPDWLALVSPYPRFLEHLPIPAPAAIVRIVETEAHAELSIEQAGLFDLTPREASIASALLAGHSLESLSNDMGISRNTARVHLQSLFHKTGTNRQSDLVRILSEVARH